MNKKAGAVSETADGKEPLMMGNGPDMLEKILADVQDLAQKTPLSGWALVAENISIDEAERERLIQEIPCFREQAIHAIAYWVSLSRRVDALTRTRQLLAHRSASLTSGETGLTTHTEAHRHD